MSYYMYKFNSTYNEIILLIVLSFFDFNFIGTISLADIYILLASPFLIYKTNWKDKSLKFITLTYSLYLIVQIISEFTISNTIENTSKGLALTIVSFFTFLFYYDRAKFKPKIFLLLFAGIALRIIVKDTELGWNLFEMATFKFKIGPILISVILIISYYLLYKQKYTITALIFLISSIVFFALDSRSTGLILLLIAIYLKKDFRHITFRKTIRVIIISILPLFGLYSIYVKTVLSGNFAGSHTYKQYSMLNNPYNPLEILLIGRAEIPVALKAIYDKPLTGHGSWARDKSGKYRSMQADLSHFQTDREMELFINSDKNGLPTHSVILGAGAYNGIFALIFITIIVLFFIRKCKFALMDNTPFKAILLYTMFFIIWNALFSPLPHFRFTLPLYFAISYSFYKYRVKNTLMLLRKNNTFLNK
ncbi:MAG TPA: hypothetical protein VFK73_10800 [Paludibacter sp.]|nr:hypothetical protein [Paludibacter sp.]